MTHPFDCKNVLRSEDDIRYDRVALDYILQEVLELEVDCPLVLAIKQQNYNSVNNLLVLSQPEIDGLTFRKDGKIFPVYAHLKNVVRRFQAWIFHLFGDTHSEQIEVAWMDSESFNCEEFVIFSCGIYDPNDHYVPANWLQSVFGGSHVMPPPMSISRPLPPDLLIVSSPIPAELVSYAPFVTAFPLLDDRSIPNSNKTTSDDKYIPFLTECGFDWCVPAKILHVPFSSCNGFALCEPTYVERVISFHDGMTPVDCWMVQHFVFDRG